MSLRWPDLELLRDGGDLIALSPLARDAARTAMTLALRQANPAFAHLDDDGPDAALIEALAAAVEIMGFYHDRFLTESKLGAAQLLDDVAKIVALIGYRPLPAVAATAFQYFEAVTAGSVLAGTRVAAQLASPPATVAFETHASIDISPQLNRMALSPLITAAPAAIRAVVELLSPGLPAALLQPGAGLAQDQLTAGGALPNSELRADTRALIADASGLEIVPVADARSRAVAFDRGLSRSFAPDATLLARATVVRNLRGWRSLSPGATATAPGELVGFEVSAAPIMYLPSVAAPELPVSTLELYVLRADDIADDPSEWPDALRYTEVADFSASDAADLHYRTFLDDNLHSWVILRRALGSKTLLADDALGRVYARFVPAIGTLIGAADRPELDPELAGTTIAPAPIATLDDVTVGLAADYFAHSLILPAIAGVRLAAQATWAMIDRALAVIAGDPVVITDVSGQRWIRTLIAGNNDGESTHLLRWAEPLTAALDLATTKIDTLADAAAGDVFPTWSELYAQLKPPAAPQPAKDLPITLPIVAIQASTAITGQRVLAVGASYLVLGDATHITVGDYLLLGSRLTPAFRAPQPVGAWRWADPTRPFDPSAPWLDAEVVQAIEIRGNVVRLATPVSQDYFEHTFDDGSGPRPLSELIVVPSVVSVASGDSLIQQIEVETGAEFQGQDDKLYDASYAVVTLDKAYDPATLRAPVAPATPATPTTTYVPPLPAALLGKLFVAVSGVAEPQANASWHFTVALAPAPEGATRPPITRLETAGQIALTADTVDASGQFSLLSADAAQQLAAADDQTAIAVLTTPPLWTVADSGATPGDGQFAVRELVSSDLVRDPLPDAASEALFAAGGTLVIPGRALAFTWDAAAHAPRVSQLVDAPTDPFDALVVAAAGVDLSASGAAVATADWHVASDALDPWFTQLTSGTLVAATDAHTVARGDTVFTRDQSGDGVLLAELAVDSVSDPLPGATSVWAVVPVPVPLVAGDAEAHWIYTAGAEPLPPGELRLALVGARKLIVGATASSDGATAIVDAEDAEHAGDLGFALAALYALTGDPLQPGLVSEAEIWTWDAIDPPVVDLPAPLHSQLIAVLPPRRAGALDVVAWPAEFVWWDPARRTLRLPVDALAERSGRGERAVRPADVTRLLQVLAPAIERDQLAIHYDLTTDRSIVTLAVPAGWPGDARVPAPVVLVQRADAPAEHVHSELRELAAPVEVFTGPDGRVRWSLHVDGDVRYDWDAIHVALRDWPAPGERGLTATPLWQLPPPAAWRAGLDTALPQPVTLIVSPRDGGDFQAIAAMPRLAGGVLELAPLERNAGLPSLRDVATIDLAAYIATPAAGATLALTGTTVLALPAETPGLEAGAPQITAIAFANRTNPGDPWQPITVSAITPLADGSVQFQLAGSYLALFPDGVAADQQLRLCYAQSKLTAVATARILRLAIPALGDAKLSATAGQLAVLHDGTGDVATAAQFSIVAAKLDGGQLVIDLALPDAATTSAAGLAAVYAAGSPVRFQHPLLALAQRWTGLPASALVRQPLQVQIGAPLTGAPRKGDVVQLHFPGSDAIKLATVTRCESDLLDLQTEATLAPDRLELYGVRVNVPQAGYRATLDLTPSSPQPPWLMSFDQAPAAGKMRGCLLAYTSVKLTDGNALHFEFSSGPQLPTIFARAGGPLYLFTNEVGELRADFYASLDPTVANALGAGAPANFLDATIIAPKTISQLVLTSTAWAAQLPAGPGTSPPPRPIVLAAIDWVPPKPDASTLPMSAFPELAITSVATGRVSTGVVLQSLRFNTGNFIAQGLAGSTGSKNPASVIPNALQVTARTIAADGTPSPVSRPLTLITLDALAKLTTKLGGAAGPKASMRSATYKLAVNSGAMDAQDNAYQFAASFSATGVCTLHFVLIDDQLTSKVQIEIATQYAVSPGRNAGLGDPMYPLEITVGALDPTRQLALLAPAALKPGAIVFVRTPDLQWTIVQQVTGPIVTVDPPLALAAGAAFEPQLVTGIGRLANAAQLDTDYYATLAKATLMPPSALTLPLHDRLPLTPGNSLLASLIPGDVVRVYDERARQAWGAQRRGGSIDGPSTSDWHAWPDLQYPAVIKQVDASTGLVVLATPLPDAFQIDWSFDSKTGALTANAGDVAALRVLVLDRAAVHGERTLRVLGSGDAARKFPRYVSALDPTIGRAVIAIDPPGVMAGNLEVLAFDPVKAQWSRWLRYADLALAGKKDAAFTLGFRPLDQSAGQDGEVPISVSFGDGVTGALLPTGTGNVFLRTTEIGAPSPWLAQRRRVRIVARDIAAGPVAVPARLAQPQNLKLSLETSAPAELTGDSSLGAAQWQPTLELTIATATGTLTLRELTTDDALGGAAGFIRVSSPGMAPGVVDVYVYSPVDVSHVADVSLAAWHAPAVHQWALDDEFYRELTDPDVSVAAGAAQLQLVSTDGLRAGSQLAFYPDDASAPAVVRLATVDPPTWSATLSAPLARNYDLSRAFIRGNVAPIIQGAVDRTTIGSSDGTTPSLRLALPSTALLYVTVPDDLPAPDLRIEVATQAWTRVLDFTGQPATARVWRLDTASDGSLSVVFGDGKQGAIPPAGRDHIAAVMRTGNGAQGNLAAGAINQLMTGNLAVKSTLSITDAAGGTAGDDSGAARDKATAFVLPSDRVVSADDCVQAAIGVSGVIAAALDPTAATGTIGLVVAMDDRRKPTDADLAAVHDRLVGAMPLTARIRLAVEPAAQTAVHLVIELGVTDDELVGDVFAAVTTALGAAPGGLFAAANWDIGEPLRLGALYDALFQIDGINHARVVWMADTPLPEGELPPAAVPDVFDPGATGVVRCDNNAAGDPFGRLGTFRLENVQGGG